MTQLLVDVGNTRIKWALRDGHRIDAICAIGHDDPTWLTQFSTAIDPLEEPSAIALAAVAPELVTLAALRALATRWPAIEPQRALSSARLGRFVSAYSQPERLGVDRFLACAAAAQSAQPTLVLGCGTALTIDLIDAQGHHHGGLIAPAPETMRAAVLSRTARVHWLRAGRPVEFGANTEDALEGGVWTAAAGMVERAYRQAQTRIDGVPVVIAYGGAASALAALLDVPVRIEPDLLMRGIALWLDLHYATATS